jgi:16S rRNA (cytidine1402-2'-O)-methyltransferase
LEEIIKGSMYIVSTPIGNLADMSFRAVHILSHVDYILCEDTRVSKTLFHHYNIKTPYASYHDFNEHEKAKSWIDKVNEGFTIALISDAGTPLIADPGFILLDMAIKEGVKITPIGGSTALIHALVGSGLSPYPFYFHGFLPKKKMAIASVLKTIYTLEATLIFYESPNRIYETLCVMKDVFKDRRFVVARELSKKFETYYRGNLEDVSFMDIQLKGECVILLDGYKKEEKVLDASVLKAFDVCIKQGLTSKEAIKKLAETYHVSKNVMYEFIKIKHNI